MEKRKLLVSFVEKAPRPAGESPLPSRLLALTSDGKRLVCLQPPDHRRVAMEPASEPSGRRHHRALKSCQLIGVLTEKNSNSGGGGCVNVNVNDAEASRRRIRIEPKAALLQLHRRLAAGDENDEGPAASATATAADEASVVLGPSCASPSSGQHGSKLQRIPRPANAFMLFANEWRKKLAVENPRESNKDISVRLGVLWKKMSKEVKEKYFALAREVDAEHKRKYPVVDKHRSYLLGH